MSRVYNPDGSHYTMPSALQQFREATKPGAIFTYASPSALVIHGNTGGSVQTLPADLRVVKRATSSAIYYAKGDGTETRGDFPKAHLIEKTGDAFVIYDPMYTTGGLKTEIPGERGKVNRVYFIGDKVAQITHLRALIQSRLESGTDKAVSAVDALPAEAGMGPGHVLRITGVQPAEVRLRLNQTGRPYSVYWVQDIEGVPFEIPLSSIQAAEVLRRAKIADSGVNALASLPSEWHFFSKSILPPSPVIEPCAESDAPLPPEQHKKTTSVPKI